MSTSRVYVVMRGEDKEGGSVIAVADSFEVAEGLAQIEISTDSLACTWSRWLCPPRYGLKPDVAFDSFEVARWSVDGGCGWMSVFEHTVQTEVSNGEA